MSIAESCPLQKDYGAAAEAVPQTTAGRVTQPYKSGPGAGDKTGEAQDAKCWKCDGTGTRGRYCPNYHGNTHFNTLDEPFLATSSSTASTTILLTYSSDGSCNLAFLENIGVVERGRNVNKWVLDLARRVL